MHNTPDQQRTRNRWLVGLALTQAFFLLPRDAPAFVRIFLLTGILVSLIPWVTSLTLVKRGEVTRDITAVMILSLAVVAYGYMTWPRPRYLELTKTERDRFVSVLKEIPNPKNKVRLGCAADERICASAANFVGLFQAAKWTVIGNRIERGFLAKPAFGITLLAHGSGTIPDVNDPKWGLMVTATAEQECIVKAFKTLGIPPTTDLPLADANLAEDDIAVIFGPEPAPH